MEFIQLKYFQAVAETGKIVTAAKMMFVTPPAISLAISQLERELETELFSRVGNRLVLNRQGEILLSHVDTLLFQYGAAKKALMESLSEGPMHITIVATETHLLADMLAAFSSAHPECSVSLIPSDSGNIARGAFKRHSSFLITTEENVLSSQLENYKHVSLFEALPVALVAEDHPLAGMGSVSAAELLKYSLVHSKSYPDYCSKISTFFDGEVPTIRSCGHVVCRMLAKQNQAVILTTANFKSDFDGLVSIPLETPGIWWRTHLYWRKNRAMTPAEALLFEFMSEYYDFVADE